MTFDLNKMTSGKNGYRRRLATRPIEEKLAMLDALRERAVALRHSRPAPVADALCEESPVYRTPPEKKA